MKSTHRLITIFDVKIEMQWTGKASDGTEVSGKVVVPEVSHEVTVDHLSDYVASKPRLYKAFHISKITASHHSTSGR